MPASLHGQTAWGGIIGTVTDRTANPLAGATIRVTRSNGWTRTAISREDGRYVVQEVSEGPYTIVAELSGYKLNPARVSVTADRTTIVDFVLEVRCINEDVVVDGGIEENTRRADLIAHIRILETSPPYRCQSCVCTDHRVQLINVAKRTDGVSGTHLVLLQTGAGVLTDDPQATQEPPYTRGQEFLAFLHRTPRQLREITVVFVSRY